MKTRSNTVRARPSKSKCVTFTGCWTCRSRKIKCDERQKNGCAVCEKAGLECAGYSVNLSWVTGRVQDLQGLHRRKINTGGPALPLMSDRETMRKLSAINSVVTPLDTVLIGPFGVFQSNYNDPIQGTLESPASSSEPAESIDDGGPSTGQLDNGWGTVAQSPDCMGWDLSTPELPTLESRPAREDFQSDFSLQELEPFAALKESRYQACTSHIDLLAMSGKSKARHLPAPFFALSMPMFRDQETSMLMFHYMNHVAELLQPVLHSRNPWRTTYFPFALSGCPELVLCQQNTTTSSQISTSLFHSLLSAAAFHLRNTTEGSPKFHHLGLQHRIKALRALNSAIVHPGDPQLYTLHLTAMLSLVTIDTMTGEDSDFPIHLQACRRLRQPCLQLSMSKGDSSNQVTSIYRFLTLLAQTTCLEISPRPWSFDEHLPASTLPYFHPDERSIEYIYGITPEMANLLYKTCRIAEHLAFYRQQAGTPTPASLRAAYKALGDDVMAWVIDAEPFHLIQRQERTMLEIARCQVRAFHSALLIYYRRTVLDGDGIIVDVDVEAEANAVWENLTAAEDLKDAYMGGAKRTAPMSWPAFIATCETRNREPWVTWWSRVEGYGLGNFSRQWRAIQEVWGVMDVDGNVGSWREALSRIGRLVLPV
ncbi:hypothetical protein COCCADRAFT_34908 [Bipolaris zeicola 26-R-13]|uniref:Zn(2)-C6 fungal-type domain-containing protein n=1 Tax=Cochliobolus carbonum (strain 26-R-13) TaxID=930089 RepID=W6Y7T2_COCC2|nr:uncharacterized protein COCCADRAFT_34908 [Bipolaris zeicola 26-R-13]EUC35667.1 hypothetical protein COCCADRAFT_34908 [Bipolaris zeicola 26-R-13]